MSNLSRILAFLLLVAAIGGAYWYVSQPDEITPIPTGTNEPAPDHPTVDVAAPPTRPETAQVTERTEPAPETRIEAMTDNTHADAEQGVKGRVLLPSGQPASGVPVFLMENMMNDPIRVFLMSKSGETLPPVSWGRTDEDGTFALGSTQTDKSFDLRVVSDNHPEINHKSIKVRSGDWFDTGDIRLTPGSQLRGRVVDERSKVGVPDATVYLQQNNQAHTALPTPGRERGIVAHTDEQGNFLIANAPTDAPITLTAEAPGYATSVLRNRQPPAPGTPLVIEIAKGRPIAGVVVDAEGKPIPGVQVRAQGLSLKTPQVATTTTDRDGVFQFVSLREGPYELSTQSKTHVPVKESPVLTGNTEVKLVVAPRPWVKLKVLAASGKPVKVYHLSLKRYFPNNQLGIGNVPEFHDLSVNPSYYPASLGGEWAAIRGLPSGQYVFQIKERNHAKSLSDPFTVSTDGEPVEVVAHLTLGASIVGVVVDDQGQPVRGATVSTDMNNAFSGDGGIFDLFRSMMPEKHSKAQTRTDAQGRFRLNRLAFAEYMVRVSHPAFCEGKSFDIRLEQEGQVADVGVVRLQRGTLIEGYTTQQGQAIGQVKVTLTVPPDENQQQPPPQHEGTPDKPQRMPFSASAISTNEGHYRLLKRVPPGRYKISAARQAGEQNPFAVLLDMRETERILVIPAGQDKMRIDFELPSR